VGHRYPGTPGRWRNNNECAGRWRDPTNFPLPFSRGDNARVWPYPPLSIGREWGQAIVSIARVDHLASVFTRLGTLML
jgi:hypothetical protein